MCVRGRGAGQHLSSSSSTGSNNQHTALQTAAVHGSNLTSCLLARCSTAFITASKLMPSSAAGKKEITHLAQGRSSNRKINCQAAALQLSLCKRPPT